MGTKVVNPMRRAGHTGYTKCCFCSEMFTSMGVSRHWDNCRDKPKMPRPQQKDWEQRRAQILRNMAALSKRVEKERKLKLVVNHR